MPTYTFVLRRPDGPPLDGVALVAPAARYASIYLFGAERLDRRFTDVARWPEIEREIAAGLADPLPRTGALWRLLAGTDGGATVVTFVRSRVIEVASPAGAAVALDVVLREEAGAP